MANERKTPRREFLQLMGLGTVAGAFDSTIAKALAIPANHKTGTIRDVEHIVVLMQENTAFDQYFGTLKGVRGYSDPRVAKQQNGNPVFLQPAMQNTTSAASGHTYNGVVYGWPATQFGGLTADLVVPPFHLNPAYATAANSPTGAGSQTDLGLVYRAGLSHGWSDGHNAWNLGQWDHWVPAKKALTMSYQRRADAPYHHALADAFTVGDNYFCSILSSTNPNRCYLWTGCVGNIAGNVAANGTPTAQGTNGHGGGTVTGNGYVDGHPLSWPTYPEMLESAGISWRIYQDILGDAVKDKGDGDLPAGITVNSAFVGTYTDNPILYFNQLVTSATSAPLFRKAATGTSLVSNVPVTSAPRAEWESWAEGLFAQFKADVQSGTLPQVSWLVAPAGYSEHPSWPSNYGAWYISQVLGILVANPEVFSKTAFIINYDENDGYFDHVVPPTPPLSSDGADGASTVGNDYELVPGTPVWPLGLGVRVPLLVISPWSKGGYVNSQVFDHTSVIRFIEKRFGVPCPNISPWRRAVAGDLTSCFNFANPDKGAVSLPDTGSWLPQELGGSGGSSLVPTALSQIVPGVPEQEQGVRPARALPYELHVEPAVDQTRRTITLTFRNTGAATAVFQVRSGTAGDAVRNYTVEPGKSLSGTWTVPAGTPAYDLAVHGPNGFLRSFKGSINTLSAVLSVSHSYSRDGLGGITLNLTNLCQVAGTGRPGRKTDSCTVQIIDAYTGQQLPVSFGRYGEQRAQDWQRDSFGGWYDLVIQVADDPTFQWRLAGHVETGRDSWSDPAMGGLVTLKV